MSYIAERCRTDARRCRRVAVYIQEIELVAEGGVRYISGTLADIQGLQADQAAEIHLKVFGPSVVWQHEGLNVFTFPEGLISNILGFKDVC